jgi:hypothetical protein
MPKPKPLPDNPGQSKRFLELAREIGATADDDTLEASVRRLGGPTFRGAPEARQEGQGQAVGP